MEKMRRLTLKQRGFVKRLIETKNGTRAALDNYNTTDPGTAAMIASKNINKDNVRSAIEKQLEDAGLNHTTADSTLLKLIDAGNENLNATKPDTTLKAIITLNKLLDRFPADKRIEARIDVAKMYQQRTTNDIESELIAIQQQNQLLLSEIKRNKQK